MSALASVGALHACPCLAFFTLCDAQALTLSTAAAGQSQAAPLRMLSDAETLDHLWSGDLLDLCICFANLHVPLPDAILGDEMSFSKSIYGPSLLHRTRYAAVLLSS